MFLNWSQNLPMIITATIEFCLIGLILTSMILWAKKYLVKTTPCKIKINNNPDLSKTVSGGVSLLTALTNSGIPIPSPCGGKATCKQCKVKIIEGADEPLETDKSTFSNKQIKEGFRLACQSRLIHDLSLEIDPKYLNVQDWTGTVISNNNVATFIKELVIQVNDNQKIPYKAGGYLQISVPPFKTNTSDWKKTMDQKFFEDWEHFQLFDKIIDYSNIKPNSFLRAYSLASYPDESPIIKFNIRIATPPIIDNKVNSKIPWGLCSSYIFSLQPGDIVKMTGPYGESFMKEGNKPIIFLIGGAGSSFGRSHILDLLKGKNSSRSIDLWYGARSLKENIYQEEYLQLEKDYPNFKYHLVLSNPQQNDINEGWDINDPIQTNYLFKAFELGQLSNLEEPDDFLYYLCGPPLHNTSVLNLLENYGVDKNHIILDDFGN